MYSACSANVSAAVCRIADVNFEKVHSLKFTFSHISPLFKVTGHKIHTQLKLNSEHAVKRQLLARTLDSSMIDHRSAVGAAFFIRNHFECY